MKKRFRDEPMDVPLDLARRHPRRGCRMLHPVLNQTMEKAGVTETVSVKRCGGAATSRA